MTVTGHRAPLPGAPPAIDVETPLREWVLPREKPGDRGLMEISVVVIDSERTFADVLAVRLEQEEDITVLVAVEATTPEQIRGIARGADVVVLDADLPRAAANQVCEQIRRRGAAQRVIMLSPTSEPRRILSALEAGAAAWVRKDDSLKHLLAVIRGVARGEAWLPPGDLAKVLGILLQKRDERRDSDQLLSALTPREREVLLCLAGGARRQDVAERLHMSANTVRTHLQNLMAKLGVHSSLEAVALTRSRLALLDPAVIDADDAL